MADNSERIIYFAETDYRNKRQRFGIKEKDRSRHMYVIGKTGMGKSTLLENLAIQDIQNGSGLGFIDPHGGSAELLLDHIPEERIKDVIYFAPFDVDYPISFNVMEDVGKDQRHLVADGLMAAFKKIWPDVWSAIMEYILNNILLALIEYPNSTLLGVNRMLADKGYRDAVVNHITDPAVRAFWLDEFAKYTDRYMQEAGAAIQNKIGQFVSSPVIRNIIGQPHSSFDIRGAMDSGKIMIMNLSKGRMGENNAALLGGMLITKIYLAAMSRANESAESLERLPHFYFYVDEFQSFVNESFANILSEARKYKLDLTIAHQYIEQMPEEVRDAVFGNVGTTIAFRVGPLDAELLEKVFAPKFMIEDIVNLGRNQIYLSLMIDGIGSPPFSAVTIPPIARTGPTHKEAIFASSRSLYAQPRDAVESVIKDWHETAAGPQGNAGSHGSQGQAPRPPQSQSFAPRPSYPPRSNTPNTPMPPNAPLPPRPPINLSVGASTTSGAAKRRKKNERESGPSGMGMSGGQSMPPRPQIPREALADLGTNDLKSLLADALKNQPKIDDVTNSQVEDDEMVYKADVTENDNDVEVEVETHAEPEPASQPESPEPEKVKKEINPKELENILKGNQW